VNTASVKYIQQRQVNVHTPCIETGGIMPLRKRENDGLLYKPRLYNRRQRQKIKTNSIHAGKTDINGVNTPLKRDL
jgi:hypothetical protein